VVRPDDFMTNLPLSLNVKEFGKVRGQEYSGTHSTQQVTSTFAKTKV